ncbi:putative ACR, YggU family [Hoeflea sp. IMCC20628]|nr:putative ACR, YggU family [Hoeflea sp. IMCC20628]
MVRLKARVRAVPENGKANRAIEKLIAKRLKIAKSKVRVISGDTSRNKTLRIDGDPDDLVAALKSLV